MKRIIFLSIISLVCAASAMAADKLVVSDISVTHGKEAVLDIGCELQTVCKAFQMDVELGSGYTLKLDAAGKPVAELGTATDHKIYSRRVSDDKYRFVAISMNGQQLPMSGLLLKLTIVAPSTVQEGSSVTGSVKAIEFATAQTKPLLLSNATFKVTVATPPPKGDTNGDNVVDVADIATIIDIMAGVGTDPVSARSADVNEDGTVDVADIATVIDIMAGSGCDGTGDDGGQKSQYTWDFGKGLSTETIANLIADDANWTVEYMDNDGNITGWKEATKHIGELKANGAPIAELVGIEIVNSGLSNSNNIIIRNSHIRLNRNQMKFKLPKLINGQIITIDCQSANSTATNRGLKASYDYMKRIAGPDDDIVKGADRLVRNVWQVVTDETNPVDIEFTVITGGINFFLIKIE